MATKLDVLDSRARFLDNIAAALRAQGLVPVADELHVMATEMAVLAQIARAAKDVLDLRPETPDERAALTTLRAALARL